MQKTNESHTFTGMQRDFAAIKQPAQFLYDARNIRLTAREGDSLLSITNEKGTVDTTISVPGTYLGHSLLNEYLVVFSTETNSSTHIQTDYITRIDLSKSTDNKTVIYQGSGANNLNFSTDHLIEAIPSFESKVIQKVYWTDGLNQPRIVNIIGRMVDNTESFAHYSKPSSFDFVQPLKLEEKVYVEKMLGASGEFAPGVIQYAFTYFNKYGQESNIFHTTPLYYISHADRGGSPEDKIDNAFRIIISNLDPTFDYLRIYSIQRTSLDATPVCKRIQDIALNNGDMSFLGMQYIRNITDLQLNLTVGGEPLEMTLTTSDFTHYLDYYTDPSTAGAINAHIDGIFAGALGVTHVTPEASTIVSWMYYEKATLQKITTPTGIFEWGPAATSNSAILIGKVDSKDVWYILSVDDITISALNKNVIDINWYSPDYNNGNYCIASYIDTGLNGDIVDPTELFYKGGEVITAGTVEQKDGTLFFGDIEIARDSLSDLKDAIKSQVLINQATRNISLSNATSTPYAYANQLNAKDENSYSVPCAGFKTEDYYRCGVQFQHESGKWSDPVWIDDVQVLNDASCTDAGDSITLPTLTAAILDYADDEHTSNDLNLITELLNRGYKKVRAVVVFPEPQDRTTVCQGVICPTLYTTGGREVRKDLLAQSSWFFRPFYKDGPSTGDTSSFYVNASLGTVAPKNDSDGLAYTFGIDKKKPSETSYRDAYNPKANKKTDSDEASQNTNYITNIREVEIQGCFTSDNQFKINGEVVTLHSPDIAFDSDMYGILHAMDYTGLKYKTVGKVYFTRTQSVLEMQTETAAISNEAGGIIQKSFNDSGAHGIVSGLFFEDWAVNDLSTGIDKWTPQDSPYKWMVYTWHRTGSLNNDFNRPSDKGTPTAILKKKIISNLRYTTTTFSRVGQLGRVSGYAFTSTCPPQLFDSNEVSILKLNTGLSTGTAVWSSIYKGNIDTLLAPDSNTPFFFAFNNEATISGDNPAGAANITTPFTNDVWWRIFGPKINSDDTKIDNNKTSIARANSNNSWTQVTTDYNIGNTYLSLNRTKDSIRMKYKSTPHIAMYVPDISYSTRDLESGATVMQIVEIQRDFVESRFGGDSMDALKKNTWIPCGEPVNLAASVPVSVNSSNEVSVTSSSTQTAVLFNYSWGDTYFQRYDCLKTYPFTNEDINQVVEIGSFMLETHINIDGRYDRNRGQSNNTTMSPQNFNLLNPVYSQLNNFFSYKIQDDDFYTNVKYPNQITWSKEKNSGADVDLWTNVTLSSVYDMDGSKGKVEELITYKDLIYCFQEKGISNILFNSRVQIPASDGVPIEISNSYKVDGYRYISDGIGCNNKKLVKKTPAGIYFIDSVGSHLFQIGEGIADLSKTCNLTSLFSKEFGLWRRLLYDDINHDLYLVKAGSSMCYSEILGQFTGYYDYNNISLIETCKHKVFTMKDSKLFKMFEGNYGDLLGTYSGTNYNKRMRPWGFTLISNGLANGMATMDKTFTNVELRACVDGDGTLSGNDFTSFLPLDSLETWDEYQHGFTTLQHLSGSSIFKHHTGTDSTFKRMFRIWRCDIPRNNTVLDADRTSGLPYSSDSDLGISRKVRKVNDRMRNPWVCLKFTKNASLSSPMQRTEINDINVVYYI